MAREKAAMEEARKNKPSAASIFGGAKPVDTTQREKEIEEKLSKLEVKPDERKVREDAKPGDSAWRRGEGGSGSGAWGRDDRRGGYDRDRKDDRGGYDRERGGGYD